MGYVLGEDCHPERPIPEYVPHTSEGSKLCWESEPPVAAHPSKEREGAFDVGQAASARFHKLKIAVQNKLRTNAGEVAATIPDNENVDRARNTLAPDHAQGLPGTTMDSYAPREGKRPHASKTHSTSEVENKPKQVTVHLTTGKEDTIQRKPIKVAPTLPVRELVFSRIPSLACHVACTFRAMSVNRIGRTELISNRTGIQQAFIAVGAGLTIQEWDETLRRGLADAIVRYHPKEPLKSHSVNDTLAVALRSLQSVSKITDLGLHLHVKCGCPQLKHGIKGSSLASLSRFMLPLTELGLEGNLLAQFDEACVASIGTFTVEALPRTLCAKCRKAFEPSGITLPRAFPFVLESHLLAETPAAFDLLGHEVVLNPHTRQTYRVAMLIVHNKVDQHYTTLEYADAGYAYAYDSLRGLKLVYRTAPPPAQDQNAAFAISFQEWLLLQGKGASVTTVVLQAATASSRRTQHEYLRAAAELKLPSAQSPHALAPAGLGAVSGEACAKPIPANARQGWSP